MGFAAEWLNRRALFPQFIREAPDISTGIIVVIPAYGEPVLSGLLDSLNTCTPPACRTELIIVVNAPENASPESLSDNIKCISNIESWKLSNSSFFRLYVIDAGRAPVKKWGVGLARKTGMDEAVRRFSSINRTDGVIACLDADCSVERNYFTSLHDEFLLQKERKACSVYFEHPLEGSGFAEIIFRHIIQYELHLRYLIRGMRYAGYTDGFHAVGSSLAVKADHYIKAGGMNRRQAGEDFYFVQKLVPLGGYFELNATTVFPSPRHSFRVPFGTGAMITLLSAGTGDQLCTYNISAFKELNVLFTLIPDLYGAGENSLRSYFNDLPAGIRSFVKEDEWIGRILEIQENTSSAGSFLKRFAGWFNAFRIVKFLNHVHAGIYNKVPVSEAACDLLNATGVIFSSAEPRDLLLHYRMLDKSGK